MSSKHLRQERGICLDDLVGMDKSECRPYVHIVTLEEGRYIRVDLFAQLWGRGR